LILIFVILNLNSYSQNDLKGSYSFNQDMISKFSNQVKLTMIKREDSSTGKTSVITNTSDDLDINKGHKINILKIDNDIVYYKYWKFSNPRKNEQYNKNSIFTMPISDFKRLTKPIYKKYKGANYGAYVIPFRLRGIGEDFDFESSLSLQANMVFGFGNQFTKESQYDISVGMGLTGVKLTNINSKVTENRTASAFTISLGGIIKPAKNVNFGMFIGWDFLGASDKKIQWKYNGKTWLGVGINISFNQIKTSESPKDGNQD